MNRRRFFLISATALTLIVLPVFYAIVNARDENDPRSIAAPAPAAH